MIIGAGPAGAEAAYGLSMAGARVMVLERYDLDREKPCGGGIQAGELLEFGEPPEAVVERRFIGARVFDSSGIQLDVVADDRSCSGITVKRSAYDRWLQRRAVGARFVGRAELSRLVRLRGRWHASVSTADGAMEISAALLLHAAGAGGGARQLEKMLKVPPMGEDGVGVAFQYWLESDRESLDRAFDERIELHFDPERLPEGYFWLFPKRDVLLAGVGTTNLRRRASGLSLKRELDHFLARQLPRLGLPASLPRVRRDGGRIPMAMRQSLHGDGYLLLGDAAGVCSLIHGGGIYQARKTGAFAARASLDFLAGDADALQRYEDEVHGHFDEYERRWDARLRPLFTDADLLRRTLVHGRDNAAVRQALGVIIASPVGHRAAYELLEAASFRYIANEVEECVREERDQIDRGLEALFARGTDDELNTLMREFLMRPAKRFRAILLLLAGKALGGRSADLLPMALAFEMTHTASLVHDDIIDHGEWRRGAPAAHLQYGTGKAITLGDAFIIKSFSLLAHYEDVATVDRRKLLYLIQAGCRSGLHACAGEIRDIDFKPSMLEGVSIDDYIRLVRLKTGALIAVAAEAGALLAGAEAGVVDEMREFGYELGIAFQLFDDAKDLLASPDTTFKSSHSDIREGKLTAQLVYTAQVASAADRKRLTELLSSGSVEAAAEVLKIYRKYDAVAYNQYLCRRYLDAANARLAPLPDSSAKQKLATVIRAFGFWGRFTPGRDFDPVIGEKFPDAG